MRTTQWKSSGEAVSSLCLGTMYFGSRVDKKTSYDILDAYYAAGGRFLDTANNYAFWIDGFVGGESETLLGGYFAERRNRNEIFLATKLGAARVPGPDGVLRFEGASPAVIMPAVEGSLKRMRVNHIDLLYVHIDDRETPLEDTLEALSKLVEQGKTRYIGISNVSAWRLSEAAVIAKTKGFSAFSAVQLFYSYLRDRIDWSYNCITPEFIDMAKAKANFNLLAYGPLLKGAYARGEFQPWDEQAQRFNNADSHARLACATQLAEELGVTINQLVLAYVMNTDPEIIPIFGASSLEQLNDSLGTLDLQWTEEIGETMRNAGA